MKLIKKYPDYLPELIAFAVVMLVYAPCLFFGFVKNWDDGSYIINNPYLGLTVENLFRYARHCPQGFYAPLTMYSFMLDHSIWGLNPFGYHLTNILLQSLCTVLFVRILKHLGMNVWLALGCALLWAVHPQRTESVAWIAERKDVLSGVLALGSILTFMLSFDRKKFPFAAIILFIFAVLAKPSVIGIPVICSIYAAWKSHYGFRAWKWFLLGLLLLAAAAFCVIKIMHFIVLFEPLPRMTTVILHNFLFYTVNTVFPLEINTIYPQVEFDDFWIIPGFVFFGLIAVYFWRKAGLESKGLGRCAFVFLLIFCALFAAVTGGFQFNATDYADRYSYLPALGVFSFLCYYLNCLLQAQPFWKKNMQILTMILLAVFIARTLWYLPVWSSDFNICDRGLYSARLVNDKACILQARLALSYNKPERMLIASKLLAENARRHFPRDTARTKEARINTAIAFAVMGGCMQGDNQTALQAFRNLRTRMQNQKTLFMDHSLYLTEYRRMVYLLLSQTSSQAETMDFLRWSAAFGWDENHPLDLFCCGMLAFSRKDYREATRVWRKAVQLAPNDINMKKNLEIAEKLAGLR